MRRLDKFFAVNGVPDHVYLLGYSRGTPAALDLAAAAAAGSADHPWGAHLGGVITLGGVIYGTPLADVVNQPDHIMHKLMSRVGKLADDLTTCSDEPGTGFVDKLRRQHEWDMALAKNAVAWTTGGAELAYLATQMGSHPEIGWEGISAGTPDKGQTWKLISNIIFKQTVDADDPDSSVFHLDQWFSGYCANVDRFKRIVQAVTDGTQSLTTAARLDWWRNHQLPASMKLFSVGGTMGNRSTSADDVWPLTTNDTAYNPDSIDFKVSRGNYYDLVDASGIELNDSQVPLDRARFWSKLQTALNPGAPTPKTYWLGAMGEHHWGFAFPAAYPMANGSVNPFPRAQFFKAVGTFVAKAEAGAGG